MEFDRKVGGWMNEEGIKIMRSHLKLGSEESEDAWRRIAHAARPNKRGWEEFVGVWRGHGAWMDDKKLEADEEPEARKTRRQWPRERRRNLRLQRSQRKHSQSREAGCRMGRHGIHTARDRKTAQPHLQRERDKLAKPISSTR